jgi:hypothetical protein
VAHGSQISSGTGKAAHGRHPSDALVGLFSRAVGSVLDGDPHTAQRLSELSGLLVEDEQLAIGFVAAAIEVLLDTGGREAAAFAATCTRHGRRWRVELGARAVHLDQCVGLLHLAVLTANPGVEIPAIDLVVGLHRLERAASRGGMSAQPLLDRAASQQYRQRLSQLRGEIDDLQARGDREGAERARAERDWVLSELTAGTGLRGRARTFADDGERARIAVGRAIRRALARIEQADPVIGTHLRNAVHTGMHCWYRPA